MTKVLNHKEFLKNLRSYVSNHIRGAKPLVTNEVNRYNKYTNNYKNLNLCLKVVLSLVK